MDNSAVFLGTSHGDPSLTRFCSATLYRFGDTFILVDAGEPVTALLVRRKFKTAMLDALLITHMHTDHIGGLESLVANITKYPVEGHQTDFYFADPAAIEPYMAWLKFVRAFLREEKYINFLAVDPAETITVRDVKITPIPTDHMKSVNAPSYAFLLETPSCRVLHTGDLAADFHDFPKIDGAVDLCVCEGTHIHNRIDNFIADIRELPIRQIVFNHIGPLWTDGNEYILENAVKSLPFPATVAYDGLELKF